MKILHITTIPMSLTFLRGQVGYMKAQGISVHALSSPGEDLESFGLSEGIPVHAVPMTRRITPVKDLIAAIRIRREIRRVKPTIVHAHTPKGGLLGMMTSMMGGTRIRIYQMRGLPFVTATGTRRSLLKLTEWFSCRMAHRVLCNSHSMRQVAVDERICPPEKIKVLRAGSGNGVDASERFNPARLGPTVRSETRSELGIPAEAMVIGFVGRIVKEKGIGELEEAWRSLRDHHPQAHLLIVGPFETQDPLPAHAVARLQRDPRVHMPGMEWDTPRLYSAMDLVVLPTYREGFPNVPLEAAAMGLPVVATDVPGCVDAVEDGTTGMLVPPRNPEALANAIRAYVEDRALRQKHGHAGRTRVLRSFRQESIWEALHEEYEVLSRERNIHRLKRVFDLAGSSLALIFLSPVLTLVALIVQAQMGSPVLFRQRRPGRFGRPFTIYKFRTMLDERDEEGNPLPDHSRLTRLGQLLRRTSLDELPELWNVLKGEMSLVGPRPLLTEYLPLYTPVQARRHEVRPGMTGWAQIHGRNATTWERRLALDVWYVDNLTVRLDLTILVRTLRKVLLREGINQEGVATMERFRGTAA